MTQNTKFTPGPWEKDKYDCLRSPEGKQVGVWGAGIAWVQRDEESEANARLIAAAPDMYEALKAFMIYHETDDETDVDMMLNYAEAKRQIMAALMKAEGRA